MVAELGAGSIDVVIDLVAGEQWPSFLEVLRRGRRYVTAGAIAGPMSQIDVRVLCLYREGITCNWDYVNFVKPNWLSGPSFSGGALQRTPLRPVTSRIEQLQELLYVKL